MADKVPGKISLYDISRYVRWAVIGFLGLAIIVLVLDIGGRLLSQTVEDFTPEVSPWQDYPAKGFGDIALPEINGLEILEDPIPRFTIIGDFPIFPDTALVHEIEQPREKLNAIDKAKTVAGLLGFEPENFNRVGDKFTWQSEAKTRTFSHNLNDRTWLLNTISYFQDPVVLQAEAVTENVNYGSSAFALLTQLDIDSTNMSATGANYSLVKRVVDRFRPTGTNEVAEFAVASVFRQLTTSRVKVSSPPVVLPSGEEITEFNSLVYSGDGAYGSAYLVMAGEARDPASDLLELQYTDFQYTGATSYYPLITPTQAWQFVQTGQGVLMQLIPQSKSEFDTYTEVGVKQFTAEADQTELAYYEPQEWTGYAYPIYIFRGSAELSTGELATFVFYVDGVDR